nr:transposase [Escherichia coli]
MSQKYLIRIAELERLLSEQAEALRQKDQQLSLVEETEAFLRSALARAEEKIEEDEREIEHLRAQIEKLRRMLFGTRSEKLRREVEQAEALLKQREQESDRYSGREDDPLVPRQLRQSRHRRPLPAHLPREIYRLLPEWSLCNLVCQLQALKGVGQLTAITLVAELGDFSRFSSPKQLMAFLGLVPGEYSSGNSIRPRGITKVGNSELRRLLYEAAWSYRTPAKVGAWLIYYRPDSVTQYSKDIAWKAQQRLCSRYRSLTAKGKKSQVAITAVARELTGFMWDIALAAQSSFSQQKQN